VLFRGRRTQPLVFPSSPAALDSSAAHQCGPYDHPLHQERDGISRQAMDVLSARLEKKTANNFTTGGNRREQAAQPTLRDSLRQKG
jgi:hypothetical protein